VQGAGGVDGEIVLRIATTTGLFFAGRGSFRLLGFRPSEKRAQREDQGMDTEPVEDEFYPRIRETVKPLYRRSGRKRRRSTAPFDAAAPKNRQARTNNRGANRLFRKLRRHEDFRMKLLWTATGLLLLTILIYAFVQDRQYRRIERMTLEERAAWKAEQAAKQE